MTSHASALCALSGVRDGISGSRWEFETVLQGVGFAYIQSTGTEGPHSAAL